MQKREIFIMSTIYSDIHFDSKHALKYGTNEAILLNHIGYICKLESEFFLREGRYWYRISAQKLHERFKFICLRTIKKCLKDLVKKKALLQNSFNEKISDRTAWYSYNLDTDIICTIDSAEIALSEDHGAENAPAPSAEIALSSLYKEINKGVVASTTNRIVELKENEANMNLEFDDQKNMIIEYIEKLGTLRDEQDKLLMPGILNLNSKKSYTIKLVKHYRNLELFIAAIKSISNDYRVQQISETDYSKRTTKIVEKIMMDSEIIKTKDNL